MTEVREFQTEENQDTLANRYDVFKGEGTHFYLRVLRDVVLLATGIYVGIKFNLYSRIVLGPEYSFAVAIGQFVTRLSIEDCVLDYLVSAVNPRFLWGIPERFIRFIDSRYNSRYSEVRYQKYKQDYFALDTECFIAYHIKETDYEPILSSKRYEAYMKVMNCILGYHLLKIFKTFYTGFVIGLFTNFSYEMLDLTLKYVKEQLGLPRSHTFPNQY